MEFWREGTVQYFSGERWVHHSNHPTRFSPPLYSIALFSSSTSFLMLRSSFFIRVESSFEVLSYLLAWEFDSSSFWFSLVCRRSTFWDSIVFHSSSFRRVSTSILAKRAWICCCCIAFGWGLVFASISYFEELFCHWERWLEWLAIPIDGIKLMMQKISSWAPRRGRWTMLLIGSSS